MLQSMGSQRVGHDRVTELKKNENTTHQNLCEAMLRGEFTELAVYTTKQE